MDITSASSATASQFLGDGSTRVPVQTLGQDDFLKLLVAQLSQQDPLNPQGDTQFIAQMASFSALEQSKAMQQDIAKLRGEQQLLQANDLIGRIVTLQDGQDTTVTGIVSSVLVEAGTPKLVVNDLAYDLSEVLFVAPAVAITPTEGVQP